ncbi:DUF2975 domain-containing protein [Clostridium sp. P21]|uniref:DUF2975 domain-containing protein n=2 Tax=Clostridium muellerianum TaxID=2716538 RepID=A0A7Y0EDA8_9CLOT|nr:DUF2975 domain-containing protein [Clostridium muellerianum]
MRLLNPSLRFVKTLLSVFLIIEIMGLPMLIIGLVCSIYMKYNIKNNLVIGFFIVVFICVMSITFHLREVIKAFINKEIFILKNVMRLRKIGFSTIIVGVFVFSYRTIKYGLSAFIILNLDDNGIVTRIDTVLWIFIGVIILIFAEIFKEAVRIKKENDLTV